jgi:hypothetical protein
MLRYFDDSRFSRVPCKSFPSVRWVWCVWLPLIDGYLHNIGLRVFQISLDAYSLEYIASRRGAGVTIMNSAARAFALLL